MDRSPQAEGACVRAFPKNRREVCKRSFGGLYVLTGFSALVWFLVRVLPKPSRAAYPCQRVAMPLASSFLLWLLSLGGMLAAFRKAQKSFARARYAIAAAAAAGGFLVAYASLNVSGSPEGAAWTPADPPNAPIGLGKGIHPGRVVWVHDPAATNWNGSSNYWWSDENTDQAAVDRMLSLAVRALAGAETDAAAWDAIFRHFNRSRGRGDVGYQEGEEIAVKINMNVASSYSRNNAPIASPQVVRALLRQLVGQAKVLPRDIYVYDASRCIVDAIFVPCHAEFPEVHFVDNDGGGDRDMAEPDPAVPVYYSGPGAGASGTTRLPDFVVRAKYLLNVALLRGHSLAGVTLCGKNHFGSVWRPDASEDRGWKPSNLHTPVGRDRPMGSYNCLVDLGGHRHLGGKTLLFLIDALYGARDQGSGAPHRWRMSPFGDDWTSSLFVSQDGVAIDSVALDFCRSEPTLASVVTGAGVDNYLHEAALAGAPPSGTFYDPEGDGTRLESLGVHEHWDGADTKRYSRNLGIGEGIELLLRRPSPPFRRGDANADGGLDVADAVRVLLHLFGGTGAVVCASAADADDSGSLEVTDALYLLRYLFLAGPPPPAPFEACGDDPTPDALPCSSYPPCGR